MKAIRILAVLALFCTVNVVKGQEKGEINLADSTGLPGDNFSLQGALDLFKEAKSVEAFEKMLNQKDNSVNNLDLDGNGKTDYIKVNDMMKENAHALVLQVAVSQNETQDIAVIEVEKKGNESAMVQIVGDKQLYPENTIVEPVEGSEPADAGNSKKGPSAYSPGVPFVFVNVWGWPCVRFIYAPVYTVWVSPWYWGFYPPWWSPWAPAPWQYHYMSSYHYHHHYHYAPHHYTTYAHDVYMPRRSESTHVTERYHNNHVRYQARTGGRKHTGAVNTGRNPQQVRPSQGAVSRPAVTPSNQEYSRPSSRPNSSPESRPKAKPSTKPVSPQVKPQPQSKPQIKPTPRPSHQSRPAKPATPTGSKAR